MMVHQIESKSRSRFMGHLCILWKTKEDHPNLNMHDRPFQLDFKILEYVHETNFQLNRIRSAMIQSRPHQSSWLASCTIISVSIFHNLTFSLVRLLLLQFQEV